MNSDEEIDRRLNRLLAAFHVTRNHDLSTLRATVKTSPNSVTVTQDFRSGASNEDLSNWLYTVVSLIAHLRDHLENWADRHGRSQLRVRQFFDSSRVSISCVPSTIKRSTEGGRCHTSPIFTGDLSLKPNPVAQHWSFGTEAA